MCLFEKGIQKGIMLLPVSTFMTCSTPRPYLSAREELLTKPFDSPCYIASVPTERGLGLISEELREQSQEQSAFPLRCSPLTVCVGGGGGCLSSQ